MKWNLCALLPKKRSDSDTPLLAMTAKFFTWTFFCLIVDQTLVMGFKLGLPVKPTYAYTIIAIGLFASALLAGCSLRQLTSAKVFFIPFLALVAVGAIMYRGENVGPDFGAMVLRAAFTPSSMSYAVWPALNLVASAGLFLLASREEFRRTIVLAAFAALVLQIVTMEADMWWPAMFGDPNGRAGGLAQNANIAALLVVVLAALTTSTRLAPYAIMLATAGVLLSQSKTGGIADLMLAGCFLFAARRKSIDRPSLAFAGVIVLMLAGTVYFSPVINPSPEKIAEVASTPYIQNPDEFPVATLDRPVPLEKRIEARVSVDSAHLRWTAAQFFLGLIKEHRFGFGTGFSNKFATGPHNSFLKLAVDNGVGAALLLLALLAGVSWHAMKSRSPQMISLALIAWVTATFYHTIMLDPIVLPAIAVGLAWSNGTETARKAASA
jgi:hypothetical protein